jgi:hypothetical protein
LSRDPHPYISLKNNYILFLMDSLLRKVKH